MGLGMMAADMGIQLVNNGISVTRSIYNFGYNIIYGRPKTSEERIEELTQQIQELTKREKENVKRIEELSQQIKQMHLHRIRINPIES